MRTGSTEKTTLIYLLVLSLLLGIAVLGFQVSAGTVVTNVKIEPDRVDLGADYPRNFKFTLWFSGKYKKYNVSDIDHRTIMIENTPITIGKGKVMWEVIDNTVTFKVDGQWLIDSVIWLKIYHMGHLDPNPDKGTWFPHKVDIKVTGQFYDETSFTGTDTIKVYT